MRRKWICLALCAVLLAGLAACGAAGTSPAAAEVPTAPPAPSAETTPESVSESPASPVVQEGISYAEAYLRYLAVLGAVTDEVERRIETHNAVLESRFPDSYYMNSNYLMQVYAPFHTAYPAMGSALADDRTDVAEDALRSFFPDAQLTMTAPGAYEAVYTYVDKTSGEEVAREGRCVWECDNATGAFRVRAYLDGELEEFTEFVPQGGDTYLLYTMTDKALVTCVDSRVSALAHAHRISEAPLGTFPGDVRLCSLEEDDFYPAAPVEESWITADNDAQYILTLSGGEMVYAGRVSQDILDDDGNKIGLSWQEIEPITLLK